MASKNDPDLGKRPPPLNGDADARSRQRRAREKEKCELLRAEIAAEFGPQLRSMRVAISQSWGTYKVKY